MRTIRTASPFLCPVPILSCRVVATTYAPHGGARAIHDKRKETSNLTPHTLTEAPQVSFTDLPVSEPVRKAVADQGWESPTPIQALTLPVLLSGEDVVGIAQTGSGKTAAFSIPLLEAIDPKTRGVQALVLAPTRGLAAQAGG